MTDYTAVASLCGVYLEDSYVLQIVEEPGTLRFWLEVVLTPQHPAYHPPKSNEQYCYAKGWLFFPDVAEVEWKRRSSSHFTDATGDVDLGNIDYLKRGGDHWSLGGDWGDVVVHTSTDPQLVLDSPVS